MSYIELVAANNNPLQQVWGIAFKGCLIVTVFIIALFTLAVLYMQKLPSVQANSECANNLVALSQAISRYNDVNDHRPRTLEELRDDYLPRASLLRCPLDKSPGNKPSYFYNPDAKNNQVMLECDRHRGRADEAVVKIQIFGDGQPDPIKTIRDTVKAAEKSSKMKK